MIRTLRLLSLLWTFVVVPTLCPAGVLVHACHEEEEATTSCSHEDDCDADPCLQASTLCERPAPRNLVAYSVVVTPVVIHLIATELEVPDAVGEGHLSFPRPNTGPLLPGAQPLLI